MLTRITIPLLGAAVLVFACGPRTPASLVASRDAATADSGVTSRVRVDTAGGTVRFAVAVTNRMSRRVELMFPDGRTHDFIVLDDAGREVWRWSAGRLFTQGVQNRLLDVQGAVEYRERWGEARPGRYTLVAEVRSRNYPARHRVPFEVPGARQVAERLPAQAPPRPAAPLQ